MALYVVVTLSLKSLVFFSNEIFAEAPMSNLLKLLVNTMPAKRLLPNVSFDLMTLLLYVRLVVKLHPYLNLNVGLIIELKYV